ncbi:MAG: UDP-N-acetylglucosamine 2-epimerase (non-hydrolyzing) [Clostridiales bacterium]|nr:UDP-N-acetylglucosamine 2-epimerase (non-hydrolyzing) [Clostridiales bacterium]
MAAEITVMSVFGTRPEASKMAPVINEMRRGGRIRPLVLVTAQHRQMLDQTLSVFGVAPDFDLNIMREGQSLADITSRALYGVSEVIRRERPDLVLVHGDTTTTFASALAAFYEKTAVGHVEAGLRTFDKYQPFPEEINRRFVSAVADLNFAPTAAARDNLLREGVNPATVFVTGNTAVDAMRLTVREDYHFEYDALNDVDFARNRVIAMTAHRRENIGEPLAEICRAAAQILERYPDAALVYAVHPNPSVRATAESLLGHAPRALLTPPLNMRDMHNLMARSYLVMTDSGGLQEEAPSLDVPIVVLRNVTERPEGLAAGALALAGTSAEGITREVSRLFEDSGAYKAMASARNPFGDGRASERINQAVEYRFGLRAEPPESFG